MGELTGREVPLDKRISVKCRSGRLTPGILAFLLTALLCGCKPVLLVTPPLLDFGSDQNELSFTVSNTGKGPLEWTASGYPSWLAVNPSHGMECPSASSVPTPVRVSINREALEPGSYESTIWIGSGRGYASIAVRVNVETDLTADFSQEVMYSRGFRFQDASTSSCGDIVIRQWDFGDGAIESGAEVSHSFPGEGEWNVCLHVENSCGGADEICRVIEIDDCDSPVADFTWSREGQAVSFHAATTIPGEWNFGDGISGQGRDPVHVYTASGTYRVCLLTEDGCSEDEKCVWIPVGEDNCEANLIRDSGFELGSPNPCWTEFCNSNDYVPYLIAQGSTHNGSWYADFRGYYDEASQKSIEQTVMIPQAQKAELQFYLWTQYRESPLEASSGVPQSRPLQKSATKLQRNETSCVGYCLVAAMDGNELFAVDAYNSPYDEGYGLVSLDVSAYANGGSHVLKFSATSEASSYAVDDVCLTTSAGGGEGEGEISELEGTWEGRVENIPQFLNSGQGIVVFSGHQFSVMFEASGCRGTVEDDWMITPHCMVLHIQERWQEDEWGWRPYEATVNGVFELKANGHELLLWESLASWQQNDSPGLVVTCATCGDDRKKKEAITL